MNYTPGPWRVVRPKKPNGMFYLMGKRNRYFAEVRDYDGEDGADAHLIAAAPEMLAALKGLVSDQHGHIGKCCCPWCEARAAIAKAEGRDT